MDADVIVVGAGLAGHSAALEAAAQGASVILLEKEAKVGGSTILSGGSFAFSRTNEQDALGIVDSDAFVANDLFSVGENHNDPAWYRYTWTISLQPIVG